MGSLNRGQWSGECSPCDPPGDQILHFALCDSQRPLGAGVTTPACRLCNEYANFLDFKTLVKLPSSLLKQIRTARSRRPGYKYETVRPRRKLLKRGYRFESKRGVWVNRED